MMRLNAWLAGVLVLCGTSTALADDGKIKLGLRLGYAIPFGKLSGDTNLGGQTLSGPKLSDGISGQIPIGIDAGYMVTPNVLVGLYGQYGFAFTKNCASGDDCSAHDVRFGVQGQYHFSPEQSTDPWLGLGFGYEWLGLSDKTPALLNGEASSSIDGTIKGWELLNLQGGVDFQAANALTVGPFVSMSLGKYATESTGGASADIPNTAVHGWLTLGVKGTFGI